MDAPRGVDMKIGVLHGMENTFPPALVQRINDKDVPGLAAEMIRIGCVRAAEPSGYDVLVDRISHDVEFYRSYLKNAAIRGAVVLNDPFRASEPDLFCCCATAKAAGATVPRTAILPQKEHPPGTTVQSLRNLQFPLDWEETFRYISFPALLKRVRPGRWKGVIKVGSPEEFFAAYDQTGSSPMMLQQIIQPGESYRCYTVGRETRVIRYHPNRGHGERYAVNAEPDRPLALKMSVDARAAVGAMGFDIAVAEFVVAEGTPYLIDVLHTAPEADVHSIGPNHFAWLVEEVANLAIERALNKPEEPMERRELAARA